MTSCISQVIGNLTVLFLFLVSVRGQTGPVTDSLCIPTLTVPRYTAWRAAPKRSLKINCTVFIPSHCWGDVALFWCKLDDMNICKPLNHTSHSITEWKNITEDTRISFLVFRNLSDKDSGLYRCKINSDVSTVSHNINVTVTDPLPDCIPTLTVPRYTAWRAAPKRTLKINCTVFIHSHCWGDLAFSWCKLDDMNHCKPLNHTSHSITEWKNITEDTRISFLVLRNLSDKDSGLYRCRADAYVSTISHNINVTVTDPLPDCIPTLNINVTVTDQSPSEWGFGKWNHVLYCIMSVVILTLAIIVFVRDIKCKNIDSKNFLEDTDLLTTVCYEEA